MSTAADATGRPRGAYWWHAALRRPRPVPRLPHPAAPRSPSCPRCALPLRGQLAVSLLATLTRADGLLAELRASAPVVAPPPVAPTAPTAPTDPVRTGMRGSSVPRILLGLGALCLLVAAVTFLAVAWASLGVGGRTVVLVALTGLGALTSLTLARRGLRVGAEAMATVALGLLALDVVGAEGAGWLGSLDLGGLLVALGLSTLGGAMAMSVASPGRRNGDSALVAPQLVAALGLTVATLGAVVAVDPAEVLGTGLTLPLEGVIAVAAAAALALAGRRLQLRRPHRRRAGRRRPVVDLAGRRRRRRDRPAPEPARALARRARHRAAGCRRAHRPRGARCVHRAPCGLAIPAALVTAALVGVVLVAPALNEGATRAGLAGLGLLVAASVAALVLPARWRLAPLGAQLVGVVPALAATLPLGLLAAERVLSLHPVASRDAGVSLGAETPSAQPWLVLGLAVALAVAVAVHLPQRRHLVVAPACALVVLGAATSLACLAVPLWSVVAMLALPAGLAALAVRLGPAHPSRPDAVVSGLSGALLLGGLVAALPSAALTTGVLALACSVGAAALLADRPACGPPAVPCCPSWWVPCSGRWPTSSRSRPRSAPYPCSSSSACSRSPARGPR